MVTYFNTALYVFKYISNSTQIRINPSIVRLCICVFANARIHTIAIDTHINSIHIHSQNTTSRALQN